MRVVPVLAALVGLTLLVPHHAPLVWNASASAPRGLYWRMDYAVPHRGDLALVRPPPAARALAAARGYLPDGMPLLKIIAASGGDTVCRTGGVVRINDEFVARALETDGQHRPLPHWSGCVRLSVGQEFLLMPKVAASFDGRYFGVTPTTNNLARLTPLWTY